MHYYHCLVQLKLTSLMHWDFSRYRLVQCAIWINALESALRMHRVVRREIRKCKMHCMCMVGLSAFITFQSLAHPSLLVTTVSLEDGFLLVAALNFNMTLFDSGYLSGFCEFMQNKYCLNILCEFIPLLRFWIINVIWKVGMSYISCYL